ncbi:hypothetical protein FQN54_008096 [Arachnomyces sp. PD_36]|nr:hypothetical protein FQN54_008096 [Arachnomyces sp. PD_36]
MPQPSHRPPAPPRTKTKKKRRRAKAKAQECIKGKENDNSTPEPTSPTSHPVHKPYTPPLTVEKVLNRFTKSQRRFYEPLVLLRVIDPVRGIRFSDANYGTDDTLDDLRRSFIKRIATICDSRKGGDTVTAAALQSTPQHTIVWLAANQSLDDRTIQHIRGMLDRLAQISVHSKSSILEEITHLIIEFCKPRLKFYRLRLAVELPQCLKKIHLYESVRSHFLDFLNYHSGRVADSRLFQTPVDNLELREAIRCMNTLETVVLGNESSLQDVINVCLQFRVYFPVLSDCARRDTNKNQPIIRAKHYIGRLASYLKTAKAMVDGAFELPCILSDYQLQICQSSPYMPSPLNPDKSTLDGIVHRMFPDSSADEVRADLERLNIFRNMADRVRAECNFRTRVHAELLLVDTFRLNGHDFYAGDRYIGCSKPACFCCYHYINSLPQRFIIPQCHNKIYTHWRAPDLIDRHDLQAAKEREDALNTVTAKLRREVRCCIDDKPMRIRPHFDSVTGSTSVDQTTKS